jgi:hypothetical protein
MDGDVADDVETAEDILNCDVSDDVLERTGGSANGTAITWIYCTHAWYNCGWPQ